MSTHFDPYARHYASLSVKDLLEAREAYHIHLTHMENVFATAIGLYRIREGDLDHDKFHDVRDAAARERGKKSQARTMENSSVKPWSWPCVLVFVKEWLKPEAAAKAQDQMVPPFLYLPDGRVIPTCVVQANTFEGESDALHPYTFSTGTFGGGYPVITEVQGQEHRGSVGCLVTDGSQFYALTNQHVAGDPGQKIYTLVNGQAREIGRATSKSIRSAEFTKMYPGLSGADTRSNLDAALVAIEDITDWTAQIFGLGVLGPLIEFNSTTASLDWIGCKVVAHGAHSGRLEGEIKALFYRYRTIGGVDYVSDFLIGGRGGKPMNTMPGDSGTLWCIDPEMLPARQNRASETAAKKGAAPARAADSPLRFRPFAIQWGGQKLSDSGPDRYTQYALAASVSVACRELDVDVVADLNAELPQYWGAVGHYKIAELAIASTSGPLKAFLQQNLEQLTYSVDTIASGSIKPSPDSFVPLADVPDVVWKSNINRGGEAVRPQENWNHYADMDLPGADGRTLFDLCGTPARRLDLNEWLDFYRSAPKPAADQSKSKTVNMGSLPFRVWQIFDAMIQFRQEGNGSKTKFLCAAGILAHYIGDACQPLHSSMHADGLDGAATGVHSTYEEKMIDRFAPQLTKALTSSKNIKLAPISRNASDLQSGCDAGLAAIDLMARVHKYLPPAKICQTYNTLGGGKSAKVIQGLWNACQQGTLQCIADGARTLGMLWQAAYDSAKKPDFAGVVSRDDLQSTYEDHDFLPSEHLANLDPRDYPVPSVRAAGGGQ